MRVKLLKTIVINAVSNTEPQRAGSIVDVDDGEGRELVAAGYAEETSDEVTAEAKKAPEPQNKMAQESANKQAGADQSAGGPTPVSVPAKTAPAKTVGTVPAGKK